MVRYLAEGFLKKQDGGNQSLLAGFNPNIRCSRVVRILHCFLALE
jgi:hypothetical protein